MGSLYNKVLLKTLKNTSTLVSLKTWACGLRWGLEELRVRVSHSKLFRHSATGQRESGLTARRALREQAALAKITPWCLVGNGGMDPYL